MPSNNINLLVQGCRQNQQYKNTGKMVSYVGS